MSVWSDIWGNIQALAGATEGDPTLYAEGYNESPDIQAAATGIVQTAGFFGFIEGFLTALTDPGMWISLGWLTLGVVLIISGVRLWMGKPLLPSPPPVVPIPV